MRRSALSTPGLAAVLLAWAAAPGAGKLAAATPQFNLVLDGGFERAADAEDKAWSFGWSVRFKRVSPGRSGERCLRVKLARPDWQFARQTAALPAGAAALRVRCAARLEGVRVELPPDVLAEDRAERIRGVGRGEPKVRGAKVFTVFHDARRRRLEGWPGLAIGEGTRRWKTYRAAIDVPESARSVRIMVGLEHASGTAWFDDVCVEALDASGRRLAPAREVRTDTRGWWAFRPPPFDPRARSVFDDGPPGGVPAGRRGFVAVRDGKLCFADGGRARFWGVNLIADGCFPDRKTAEGLAACLARFGCNMVRMVFLDAPVRWWGRSIFPPGETTRRLDPQRLDELHYLIAQLKRRGVYVHVELLSRREFRAGDGVRDYDKLYDDVGLSPALLFNPRLIALQRQFARQLLTSRNPYTKLRLCDDPAVALISLMNENSMFVLREPLSVDSRLAPSYQRELTALWNRWLRDRYGRREKLAAAWGEALRDGERWEDGRIAFSDSFEQIGLRGVKGGRLRDCIAFLRDVERSYLRGMRDYLRGLGVRVPISASSRAAESCQAVMDTVDHHTYWDHPADGWGWKLPIRNASILARDDGRDHLMRLFSARVFGRPFTVTEWAFCWPNEFRCEGPIVLAAAGAAQDVDCFLMYGFGARGGGDGPYDLNWPARLDSAFRLRGQPTVFCQWPAAARLFVRGDVGPLAARYVFEQSYADAWEDPRGRRQWRRMPKGLFRKGRVGKRYVSGAARWPNTAVLELPVQPQLIWRRGALIIDTPRTQGAVGYLGGATLRLSDVTIRPQTPFCSLTLTSLDAAAIARSRRLLLTAVARAENSGCVYAQAKTRLRVLGEAPILIEPVRAEVCVRTPRRRWTLTPLDAHACRRADAARTLTGRGGGLRFPIGRDRCLWYELRAVSGGRRDAGDEDKR